MTDETQREGVSSYSRSPRSSRQSSSKRKETIASIKKEVEGAYRVSRDKAVNSKLERALSMMADLE